MGWPLLRRKEKGNEKRGKLEICDRTASFIATILRKP
jgi:hypothetical protein